MSAVPPADRVVFRSYEVRPRLRALVYHGRWLPSAALGLLGADGLTRAERRQSRHVPVMLRLLLGLAFH